MPHSTALSTIPVPGTDAPIHALEVDGTPLVSLRHVCDAIGIAYSAQLTKLKAKSWACVSLIDTQIAGDDQRRELAMIDRRTFTMWLATIDESRVAEAARPTIVAFQAEAADALDAHFAASVAVSPQMPAPSSQLDILRLAIDQIEVAQRDAAEAKEIATRSEARLDAMEGRHDWYSALGYARLHRLPNTSSQFLNKVGRQASSIAKARSIEPVKVPHQLFGEVNSYPAWIWDIALDGLAEGSAA
jgi:hypothetical protein